MLTWKTNDPDAVFLLVHGLGAHSLRWKFLGEYFQKHNISSYSIELQGFGSTSGLKGHIGSFNTYYKDIMELQKLIIKENSGKKIYLLSESMGSLISFMEVCLHPQAFDGLICISPAFASRMKFSPLQMIDMITSLLYNSKKQFVMPFTSQMCTADIDYQKEMDSSPLEHRLATSKLLIEIVFAQIKSGLLKDKVKIPVLFLLAGDNKDLLVDPIAAKNMFRSIEKQNPSNRLIQYPEMLHALSIEKGREKVFEDILNWVKGKG